MDTNEYSETLQVCEDKDDNIYQLLDLYWSDPDKLTDEEFERVNDYFNSEEDEEEIDEDWDELSWDENEEPIEVEEIEDDIEYTEE